MNIHSQHIKRCYQLAKKALGNTSPNPLVGAVIVKDGLIIGEGYHARAGTDHAEIKALKAATQPVAGATLYSNLEPCCHLDKKTPPCVEAIIAAKIKTVVISNLDPNPKVAGQGVEKLRAAGIEVVTGIEAETGNLLNEVFFTHITKKRPFIHLKWAQTLDGKIATKSFHSKWITGEKARLRVHKERQLYDAIAVGSRTASHDDPALTVRLPDQDMVAKRRIIFSYSGNISPHLKVFSDSYASKTCVVSAVPIKFSAQNFVCPNNNQEVDLEVALAKLYADGITSIYVEGGARLLESFIAKNLYDRVSIYTAPKLLGQGISTMNNFAPGTIDDAIQFQAPCWTQLGQDILFESQRNICLQDL